MNLPLTAQAPLVQSSGRPWILIAAYDVSTGESSEGYIAFNLLRYLCKAYRIVLITRRNNKARLKVDPDFVAGCANVHLVGYDLPRWASWWKRGARFYQAYAYLWQMSWPQALVGHTRLRQSLCLVHMLNFHNDSIPSLAWRLGLPVVWGPINHHEIVAHWRRVFWPTSIAVQHVAAFALRCVLWRIDPFLRVHIGKCSVVLSAGEWVEHRLDLATAKKVIRRSQLGTTEEGFRLSADSNPPLARDDKELICAGRLDWIKGVDLAIEALPLLPANYHLRIVGKGPAESRLRSLATQLGVETRVIFQPPVPRNTLSRLYAQADLFLFTSAEVAGLVWVESLASGLPVVAFDGATEVAAAARHLPGIHLVAGGEGRYGQIQSLAATIRTAVSVPRNPTALRTAVLEYYGWGRLAATISEAYSAVLGSSG